MCVCIYIYISKVCSVNSNIKDNAIANTLQKFLSFSLNNIWYTKLVLEMHILLFINCLKNMNINIKKMGIQFVINVNIRPFVVFKLTLR